MEPTILICDTETTHADVDKAGICQVAAVALTPEMEIIPLLQMYCKPSAEMTTEAYNIHHIGPEQYDSAPTDATAMWVLDSVIEQFNGNLILSGYNSDRFDYPLMTRIYPEAAFSAHSSIDILTLALRRDSGEKYKLVEVFKQVCGEQTEFLEKAHDALADCWMSAMILKEWITFWKEGGFIGSANDIVQDLATPQRLNLMPHGKHQGVPFSKVPASYLTWAVDNWTDMHPDLAYTFHCMGLTPIGYENAF